MLKQLRQSAIGQVVAIAVTSGKEFTQEHLGSSYRACKLRVAWNRHSLLGSWNTSYLLVACSAGKDGGKSQAQKALKATKKGTWKKHRKPRFSVVFHRPKTLKHARQPQYPRIR